MSTSSEDDLDALIGEWADAASGDDDDLDSIADAWARQGRRKRPAVAEIPPPPPMDEPITLPKRPDPVLMPPLPSGDYAGAAKNGDTRYASPIAPAIPAPAPQPPKKEAEPPPPAVPAKPIAQRPAPEPTPPKPEPTPERQMVSPIVPGSAPTPQPATPKPTPSPPSISHTPQPPRPATPHLQTETAPDIQEDRPGWRRWIPFGLLALGVILWLVLMALSGQNKTDGASPPRVIDQPELAGNAAPNTPAKQEPPKASDAANPKPADSKSARDTKKDTAKAAPIKSEPAAKPRTKAATGAAPPASKRGEANTSKPKNADAHSNAQPSNSSRTDAPENTSPAAQATQKPAALTPVKADANAARDAAKPETPKPQEAKATSQSGAATKTEKAAPSQPKPQAAAAAKPPANAQPSLKPSAVNTKARSAPTAPMAAKPAAEIAPSKDRIDLASAPPKTVFGLLLTGASSETPAPKAGRPAQDAAVFETSLKRALDYGEDGQAMALETPDGRLLAMRVDQTHMDQVRSILIPRAQEITFTPSNLILKEGIYETRRRVGVRPTPIGGPAARSLESGEEVQSVGMIAGTDWQLVAQNGRGIGYLKSGEIKRVSGKTVYPVYIDDPKSTAFDIARVSTVCRTVQYAIDKAGGSGSFTACRAYGGEWVLENGGDTPPLSPSRYVYKR